MHPPHDGGPAFPQPIDDMGTLRAKTEGMSLRDYFATAFLTTFGVVLEPDYVAAKCYRMADAMLRARARAAQPQEDR